MAKETIEDGTVFLGPHDISGLSSEVAINYARPEISTLNLGSGGWDEFLGGIKSASGTVSAMYETDDPLAVDATLATPVNGEPFTISKTNPLAAADVVHGFPAIGTQFNRMHPVGGLFGFTATFKANAAGSRGSCLQAGAITVTANGTGQQLGAATAAQHVYAWLHVTAATGSPTLDYTIESDATDGWSGAETTRFTFTQATGATYQWATPVAGAITDTWWRSVATFGGTGSITAAIFLGIQ